MWYKNLVTNTDGIFFGNGISEQMTLKVTKINSSHREEIPENFCYVINHGKPLLVKYVEDYQIENN